MDMVHIRFEGRSHDVPIAELDIGSESTDGEIRQEIASWLEVDVVRLQAYVVEKHNTGNITLRPEAVFG